MEYTKPKLVELPGAIDAIQSGIIKGDFWIDNVDPRHPLNATAAAYEADE